MSQNKHQCDGNYRECQFMSDQEASSSTASTNSLPTVFVNPCLVCGQALQRACGPVVMTQPIVARDAFLSETARSSDEETEKTTAWVNATKCHFYDRVVAFLLTMFLYVSTVTFLSTRPQQSYGLCLNRRIAMLQKTTSWTD